jgi:hypothetical protein
MDRMLDLVTMELDPTAYRLRRVGRLARRRMRIEAAQLSNGVHSDGGLTVTISGFGSSDAGAPASFEWQADRPVALVIIRAGLDGDDVSFEVGPLTSGRGPASIGEVTGIRYIAFCYDSEPEPVLAPAPNRARLRLVGAASDSFDRPLIMTGPMASGRSA